MTGPSMFFGMSVWPGPRAGASIVEDAAGHPMLSLFVDPLTILLTIPPFPGGPRVLARMLRELSAQSGRLASELDEAARLTGLAIPPWPAPAPAQPEQGWFTQPQQDTGTDSGPGSGGQ